MYLRSRPGINRYLDALANAHKGDSRPSHQYQIVEPRMRLIPPHIRNREREWLLVSLVAFLSVFVMSAAYGIGRSMTRDLEHVQASIAKPVWNPHQLAVEHGRLLLAVQSGADLKTLQRQGAVVLRLADLLKDAPQFSEAAKRLENRTDWFDQSIRHTRDLLGRVAMQDGRESLYDQLQRDAPFLDAFTVALSDMNRNLLREERIERASALRANLYLLQYLHVAILGVVLLVIVIIWRLFFAVRERERQNATQASILKVVDDGIIGVCENSDVSFFNDRAETMLEHVVIPGCPLPRPTQRGGGLLGHVRSLLKEGERLDPKAFTAKRAVQLGEGVNRRHYNLRLSRSHERLGSPSAGYAYVITMRDVTVEVEAAQQCVQYEAGLSQVSRVMSYAVISGGLVHEISQPLAALQNYLHVLRSSPECAAMPEPMREIFGHLGVEADRVSEIVRNVRLMGPQDAKPDGSCLLSDAVAQSIRLVSMGLSPTPDITVSAADDGDVLVKGALPLLGQVIVNLLKNALQASSAAGQSGAVVFLRRVGAFAEIAVADRGLGVSPDAAAGLFEPFSKSSCGGMGLGLAICKRIAANLGGAIAWENRAGGGALFTFHVPLAAEG